VLHKPNSADLINSLISALMYQLLVMLVMILLMEVLPIATNVTGIILMESLHYFATGVKMDLRLMFMGNVLLNPELKDAQEDA